MPEQLTTFFYGANKKLAGTATKVDMYCFNHGKYGTLGVSLSVDNEYWKSPRVSADIELPVRRKANTFSNSLK